MVQLMHTLLWQLVTKRFSALTENIWEKVIKDDKEEIKYEKKNYRMEIRKIKKLFQKLFFQNILSFIYTLFMMYI